MIAIVILRKKVKLVMIEFIDYIIIWRDQIVTFRRQNREKSIDA